MALAPVARTKAALAPPAPANPAPVRHPPTSPVPGLESDLVTQLKAPPAKPSGKPLGPPVGEVPGKAGREPDKPEETPHVVVARLKGAEPGPRYCAFFLAGFPAWALARLYPDLARKPFVVVQGGQLRALSPGAHQLGVELRWSVERLRALHPEVLLRPRHPAQEAVAWEQVMVALARLSPSVEELYAGLALLDLPEPEQLAPLLRKLGAQGGAGYDRASAELAAYSAPQGVLQAIGRGGPGDAPGTREFLRQFPLGVLEAVGVSADTIERLGWFGWSSMADLRALTRGQLEAQFPEGALLYRYARAEDLRPIALYSPAPRLSARLAFPEPVREPAEWEGALDCLVKDLTAALGERKPYSISLSIETSLGRRRERYFLREATASRRTLTAAAQRLLLSLLGDGVLLQTIRITLGGFVTHRSRQISLFETGRQEAGAELAETLQSLEARYPGLVRRVRLVAPDAYLPEESFLWEALEQRDLLGSKTGAKGAGKKAGRSTAKAAGTRGQKGDVKS